MQKVVVDIENDRDPRFLADVGHGFEHTSRGSPGFQSALRRQLVHQPIRQRIAERHAQFHHIHPRLIECNDQFLRRGQVGVAGTDIGHQGLLPLLSQLGKSLLDPIHAARSVVDLFGIRQVPFGLAYMAGSE